MAKQRKTSKPKGTKSPGKVPASEMFAALQAFANALTAKFSANAPGEPEDQLKPPMDQLIAAYAQITGTTIIAKGESQLADRIGRPDFVILADSLQIGYIELKAPGKGANTASFRGHDKKQWQRFMSLPNLIYTDGNEWGLYRSGKLVGRRVRLSGDVQTDGSDAVTEDDATTLLELLADFTSWKPIVPKSPKALAEFLAPFCRLLRGEVLDAIAAQSEPIESIKRDVKSLLFPEADDDQFADAYAQTVVFALLLAKIEGADTLDLHDAIDKLSAQHTLLSRSLEFLTDKTALAEISTSVSLAQRVINEVSPKTLRPKPSNTGPWLHGQDAEREVVARSPHAADPWLYFYEDFLAAYDPKLRKDAGAYYTPVEVVRCQVRLIDEILTDKLDHPMGFVEPSVVTLDPGVGTGTYLLGIVDHAITRVREEEGEGAVRGAAGMLAKNLHGFEWLVGPYAVAQLRFSQAITSLGSKLPASGPGIYLTNTLESPHTKPPAPPLFHKPIAQEHERALKVKDSEHVLVILGNPPYDRHGKYIKGENEGTTGGWVRHGGLNTATGEHDRPILEEFLRPARDAGLGSHLKNLYNLYVYFLRWSLWKVFEHETATGPGILSFITASSYLDGDAFVGVREHMRRVCDHIDIIDLGGEGRGTRQDENVFAIKTPVCICIAYREGKPDTDTPASVRYTRVEGTREEKLEILDSITQATDLKWSKVPSGWQDAFEPDAKGAFTKWPSVVDVFPWQNNGVKAGRTWVIGPSKDCLRERLERLYIAPSDTRPELFKDSPTGCKAHDTPLQLPPNRDRLTSVNSATPDEVDRVSLGPYGYRSFDRQYIIADARFLDRAGPSLWHTHSERQVYLTGLFSIPLGAGPASVACADIPDLDAFRGSYGAKAVTPLYRDTAATLPNLVSGLLELLSSTYGRTISAEEVAAYVYGVLAQPAYTDRFAKPLQRREVRVPWTKDPELFDRVCSMGQRLIWLHTYGQRLTPKGERKGRIPKGLAKSTKAVSDTEVGYPEEYAYDESSGVLRVGDGEFGPVSSAVYNFNVSGLKVVQSWLGYRMKNGKGKKSSPLDDIRPKAWTHQFTRELLELLWVLEATVSGYPTQQALLDEVLASELFTASEFPDVPDEARRPPKVPKPGGTQGLFEEADGEPSDDPL